MTFLFAFDQVTSWIVVCLCWWLVHQTDGLRRSIGIVVMRCGIAALGVSLMLVAGLRLTGHQFLAGGIMNTCLIAFFIGVIIFHRRRFGRA